MNTTKIFFLTLLFFFITYNAFSQLRSTKANTAQIDKELFVDEKIPSDFPPRENYKSDEQYIKVVQGYINVYTNKINKQVAVKQGFTIPGKNGIDEREMLNNRQKRKEPVSEEQKKIKKEKEENL